MLVAVLLHRHLGEGVDGTQRCPQIVRGHVRELIEFGVAMLEHLVLHLQLLLGAVDLTEIGEHHGHR